MNAPFNIAEQRKTLRGYDAAPVNSARLHNDLRTAQREWQGFAMFDAWPGHPWADERDAALARIVSIRAQIAVAECDALYDRINEIEPMQEAL